MFIKRSAKKTLLKEYSVSFKFMLCAKETTVTGAKFRCSCLSLRAYINIFSRSGILEIFSNSYSERIEQRYNIK